MMAIQNHFLFEKAKVALADRAFFKRDEYFFNHIDLQQVYLLQLEAHKDKTLTFICEYFRHHARIKH